MKVVEGLLYTKEHEWVKVDANKAYIGITDYAQKALGGIVFVELPQVDAEYNTEDTFATIESVKAASDVFIPVSGKILEVNEAIVDDPELLNIDAYENWMVLVELSDASQLNDLMSDKEYEAFINEEE